MAYANALSGFTEAVIDQACQSLEHATRGEYEPAMPSMAKLEEACREAMREKKAVTRYCGRCSDGCIRHSDGVIRRCECACLLCDNSGFVSEWRPVKNLPYEQALFAKRCPNGCKVASWDSVVPRNVYA